MMVEMKKGKRGSVYSVELELAENETAVIALPELSDSKKCMRDIGWCCSEDSARVYGTVSEHPGDGNALWMELFTGEDVNKTVTGIKIENGSSGVCRAAVRAVYL